MSFHRKRSEGQMILVHSLFTLLPLINSFVNFHYGFLLHTAVAQFMRRVFHTLL